MSFVLCLVELFLLYLLTLLTLADFFFFLLVLPPFFFKAVTNAYAESLPGEKRRGGEERDVFRGLRARGDNKDRTDRTGWKG